jgi:hypothetical protein
MNETPKHELIEELLGLTDMEQVDTWVKDYDEPDFSWLFGDDDES